MVVFGLMGLLTSCGSPVMRAEFAFLRSRFGRGCFLFLIGTLACAQGMNFTYVQYVTLVVGVVDTSIGVLRMLSYVCVSSGELHLQPPAAHSNMSPPAHGVGESVALPAPPLHAIESGVAIERAPMATVW